MSQYGNSRNNKRTVVSRNPITHQETYSQPISARNEPSTYHLVQRANDINQNYQNQNDDSLRKGLLEDHILTMTAVCKKLNTDVETLHSQFQMQGNEFNNVKNDVGLVADKLSASGDYLDKKIGTNDQRLQKIESILNDMNVRLSNMEQKKNMDYEKFAEGLLENRRNISELQLKLEKLLMEQTIVLKNVEGDSVKNIQLLDTKTRTLIEEVSNRMDNNFKQEQLRQNENIARMKNQTDQFEKKADEIGNRLGMTINNHRTEIDRQLKMLKSNQETIQESYLHNMEKKFNTLMEEHSRLKKEYREGFETVQDTVASLRSVQNDKVQLIEERLTSQLNEMRSMLNVI
ncbi:hypothetical protein SNEBB_008116 [Seison nebaliae]|nr:hypothetical protein SNEBB_008116 [Seison nebaliae]